MLCETQRRFPKARVGDYLVHWATSALNPALCFSLHRRHSIAEALLRTSRTSEDWQEVIPAVRASRRILVLGPPGSGKTYLTRRLVRFLRLEPVHLDAHFWQPGWISTPEATWKAKVTSLAAESAWVMDGTYERSLALRLPRADAVVLIEASRSVCVWRVLRRRVMTGQQARVDAPAGQKLDRAFLGYIWRYPSASAQRVADELRRHGQHVRLIVLKGGREVRRFLQAMERWEDPTRADPSASTAARRDVG